MAVEERRRIALHRAAAASWGEEVADTLVDLVAPSGHELATRQGIDGGLAALDAMEQRLQAQLRGLRHERLAAFHQGIGDAVTKQTRTLVISQLAAIVVIAGLALGLR